MKEKEINVKVKFDDYKMMSNYIKNELGFNRTEVKNIIDKSIKDINIDELFISKISSYLGYKREYVFDLYIEKKVDEIIEREIGTAISEAIKSKTKEIENKIMKSIVDKIN